MIYCYRPCGISIGHLECIHAETCTAFPLLLFELFGERPDSEVLTGVVIDRGNPTELTYACVVILFSLACDVHPYVKRIGDEGHEACAYYAKLAWMVDPFHIKGHKVSF